MHNTIEKLLNLIYGIFRYRWLILIVAWVVALLGWYGVSKIPDSYEASAQIYVDTNTILKPLLRGLSVDSIDVSEQFGLITKELLSRPNIERVVRKVDLDIQSMNQSEFDAIVDKMQRNISIRALRTHRAPRPKPPNLFVISARHEDPKVAFGIVQALLDIFIEDSLSGSRSENVVAQKFLENEIKEYEAKLVAAENRLREFRRRNIKMLPEQGNSYYQRLQTAQTNLEEVELELREEKFRRDALINQLENTNTSQTVLDQDGGVILSPIDQRIVALQTRLDELLLKYTDEHPDVSQVRESIAELKKQKEIEESNAVAEDQSTSENPVYQQIQLALGEVKANIAAIEVRRNEFRKRVKYLQQQVETLPKIEAELIALNRDYTVNKQHYDALLTRRESAKMSEAVEQTGEQVKLKVIEPPRIPQHPSAPNRLMFSTGVLFLALGMGIALAFVMSKIRAVVFNQRDLRELTGLPVIGSVTYTPLKAVQRRCRLVMIGYTFLGGMLFVAYFGVLYLEMTDVI